MVQPSNRGRWVGAVLWTVAVVLMLSSAVYQRLTGPTHPLRGEFAAAGESCRYRLPRSGVTTEGTRVAIPNPGQEVSGGLIYRRYPTSEEFTTVPRAVEDGEPAARLPVQPAAGKLEYYVVLDTPEGGRWIPGRDETVVMRYRAPVPAAVLIPHVLFMFIAVLVGIRAGLAALFDPPGMRRLAWITLGTMTIGGLILGPIVQEYAFGAFWTGFPFGYDLTDNKTLIMWLVWVFACGALVWKATRNQPLARVAVLLATVVTLAVYLIPHSLRGSELDYSQVDQGVDQSEAVETGNP
jgi:hypothetical protein